MPVFKNEGNGTWYVMARYVNWKGERKQKCKRGFATKREAQEWERKFQLQNSADLDMDFEAFIELYANDVKNRLKENTWLTKEHIITKQDYITRRLLCQDVVVQGNPRVYKALRNELAAVLTELQRIEAGGSVDNELLDTIELITVILGGLKGDGENGE